MGAVQRLSERFAFTGGKVRRPGVDGYTGAYPVVEGVLLCGPESRNRRRYKREAFAGDRLKRYEGRPVNVDHGTGGKYASQLGWVENVRHRDDGMPVGDIGVKPTHPLAESFLFDAEHRPTNCGMSHVAECRTTRAADGWDDVTAVEAVESVDVVVGPATTSSLYEQTTGGRAVPQISLKTFVERFGPNWGAKKWAAATKLVEDIGDVADAPVMDEPPADAPEGGDLKAALMSTLTPMLDEAFESGDAAALITAIKDFIKLHAKHTGKDVKADAPAGPPADDAAAEEQKKRPKGLAGFIAEAKGFGLKEPTTAQLAVLETIPTHAGRKLFCEEAASRPAERPQSSGKRPGPGELPSKPGATVARTIESVPATGAGFAALIKG